MPNTKISPLTKKRASVYICLMSNCCRLELLWKTVAYSASLKFNSLFCLLAHCFDMHGCFSTELLKDLLPFWYVLGQMLEVIYSRIPFTIANVLC